MYLVMVALTRSLIRNQNPVEKLNQRWVKRNTIKFFFIPFNFYKEEGSMVCEARLIDKMCPLSIYCLALCSHDQVVLLVLNGLGKLSVDITASFAPTGD